jgi:hypothetical protein
VVDSCEHGFGFIKGREFPDYMNYSQLLMEEFVARNWSCVCSTILLSSTSTYNDIHDDIKSRLNPGNACFLSVSYKKNN